MSKSTQILTLVYLLLVLSFGLGCLCGYGYCLLDQIEKRLKNLSEKLSRYAK